MESLVGKALGVRAGEGALVRRLFLQSACAGAPRMVTMTAANTLFLRAFDAASLPYAYAATAIVIPLVGLFLLAMTKRVGMAARLKGLLVVLLLAQLVFRGLFSFSTGKAIALAFSIWLEIEWSFSDMVLYDVAGRLLSVRQAKRLFTIVSTGEVFTFVLTGFFMPGLVARIGSENLLWIAACSHAAGLVSIVSLLRSFRQGFAAPSGDETAASDADSASEPLKAVQRTHGAYILTLSALCYSLYYIVDNAFYERAQAYFTDNQSLAAFLGPFLAVIGVTNLVVKTLISGPWIGRFGVIGSLCSVPIFVCAGAALLFAVGNMAAGPLVLLGLAALVKLLERVAVESLYRPGFFALYLPLAPAYRARLRTLGDTVFNQLAGGLVSALLLVLNKALGFTATGLSVVAFVGYAGWAVCARLATRSYRSAIAEALKQHGLEGAEIELDAEETVRALLKGLSSEHPLDVVYSLDLLAEAGYAGLDAELLRLFSHHDLRVRRAAYRHAAKRPGHEMLEALFERLAKEPNAKARGTLLRAIAASSEDRAFDVVSRSLEAESADERLGALVGLLAHAGLEGAVVAGDRLLALLRSTHAEDRMLGARVLGEVADSSFHRPLLPLFADSDPRVRQTAIWAAGKLGNERLWPYVIAGLADCGLRPVAMKALLRGHENALPALLSAYREPSAALVVKRRILRLLGHIGGPRASAALQAELFSTSLGLRREALLSLRRAGFRASASLRPAITELLGFEIGYATRALLSRKELASRERAEALCQALTDELSACRERVFLLLSLVYSPETLTQIEESYRFGSADKRAFAIELLDNAVAADHKALVLPLLDESSDDERLARLRAMVSTQSRPPQERLRELESNRELWQSEWLALCARYALSPTSTEIEIMDKVSSLRAVGIFAELPGEILSDIATRLVDVQAFSGDVVIRAGEMGTAMYIVHRGGVRVHSGEKTLAELGPSELFGELSALLTQPRTASITAIVDTHLYKLEKETLYELIADRIEIARGICSILCQRLRRAILRESIPESVATSGVLNVRDVIEQTEDSGYLGDVDRVIVLKTASLFENISQDVLAEIASRTELLWLEEGERLFRKGNVGTTLYVIVDGTVKVHDGEREIIRLGPRTVLGELSALSSEPRTATVTAVTRTRLLSLDQASLYELMWSQSEVVYNLIHILIVRLARFSSGPSDPMDNTPFSVRATLDHSASQVLQGLPGRLSKF